MKWSLWTIAGIFSIACGSNTDYSNLKEAIDWNNDVSRMEGSGNMIRFAPDLPKNGKSRPVWTGDWWPLNRGGTARRDNNQPSPMEKYDLATGQEGKATNWEKRQSARFGNVSWAGHCNGLAAAGTFTKQPTKSVTYNGVNFAPKDVKALLVEAFQGAGRIVGGRCNQTGLTTDEFGRIEQDECRDLNPGTFYLALTNFIGLHRLPVIVDKSNDEQVWNYPIVEYSIERKTVSKTEAARAISGGEAYTFNLEAKLFMQAKFQIKFVDGDKRTYDAIIEGDSRGNIIGGEWIGSSKLDHPDFIWTVAGPKSENPFIDIATVQEIYKLSI